MENYRFCSYCDFKNKANAKFCQECGRKLVKSKDAIIKNYAISRLYFFVIWILGIILFGGLFGVVLTYSSTSTQLMMSTIIIEIVIPVVFLIALKVNGINSRNTLRFFVFFLSPFSLVGLLVANWFLGKHGLIKDEIGVGMVVGLFILSWIIFALSYSAVLQVLSSL